MPSTVILEKTIYTIDQLIEMPLPQLALAGRSNVGKSSLLNRLSGRKNLAKISSTPGKTRSLNFYKVSPEDFYLVDLPGYGYARCSKSERDKWAKLIARYLQNNSWLIGVVALLDSRLPPGHGHGAHRIHHLPGSRRHPGHDQGGQMQAECPPHQSSGLAAPPARGKPPLLVSSHSGMNIDKLWQLFAEAAPSACMTFTAQNSNRHLSLPAHERG